MPEIKLPRGSWTVDESAPLGPAGGFGQVFAGTDGSLHPLAIKRLFLDTGALGLVTPLRSRLSDGFSQMTPSEWNRWTCCEGAIPVVEPPRSLKIETNQEVSSLRRLFARFFGGHGRV